MKNSLNAFVLQSLSRLAIALVIVALSSTTARAVTYTFSGTTGGTYDWDTPSTDWSGTPVSNLDTTLAYSGTLANGAAIISNNNIGSPPFQLNSLTFTNAGTAPASPAESITLQGGQLEFVTSTLVATPTLSVNLGANAPAITINNDLLLTNNLGVSGSSNLTIGGVISGAGSITKTGTGTLTLNGVNSSYTGGVTVSAGTLSLNGSASAMGTNTVNLGGGSSSAAISVPNTNPSRNFSNDIIVNPTSSGTLSLLGFRATFSGAITLDENLTFGNFGTSSNSTTTASGQITGNKTITTTHNGGGALVQITNVLNASSFTGNVIISKGILGFNNGSLGTVGTITFGANTVVPELLWNAGNTQDVSSRLILPTLASNSARLNVGANDVTFNSGLSGASGITKLGSGTLTLAAANTYAGQTTVGAGTLLLASSGSISNSSVIQIQSGATLNASAVSGGFQLASGQTLKNTGTFIGNLTALSGSTFAPGNSPGIATQSDNLTLNTGSTFEFELVANSTASAGTNYDQTQFTLANVTDLTIQSGVTADLVFNFAGSSVNWLDTFWDADQSWTIFTGADTSSFLGGSNIFGTTNIGLDSVGQNFSLTGGTFSFSATGNDVLLNYSAIPEPSTAVLVFGSLGLLAFRRRRSQKSDSK